jgi:hypothetical protein
MMSEPAYQRRWKAMLEWYRAQGILPIEEGDGEGRSLVVTTEAKGIDSAAITDRLRGLLNL